MKTIFSSLFLALTFFITAQERTGVIEVTGYAEVAVEPDYLDLQVVIENQGEKAAEVQNSLMKTSREILAYLSKVEGVEGIKTERIDLFPRHNYQLDQTTFSARQYIIFRIVKLEQYEVLMPGLLELGVNGIANSSFGSTKIGMLQSQLTQQALQNAREKAMLMANTLGQDVGKAVYISDQLYSGSPYPVRGEMDMKMSSSAPSIEGGVMEISTQVRVSFQLN